MNLGNAHMEFEDYDKAKDILERGPEDKSTTTSR